MKAKLFFNHLNRRYSLQPVFIIGCGRSGTTVLGEVLSKHDQVVFLNERRDIWLSAYPKTDIWTPEARLRDGKMLLTAADTELPRNRILQRAFARELRGCSSSVLLEKLPVNSFRLEFIHAIFPNARYIHIFRSGIEVARSIELWCTKKRWFGHGDYKWQQLREVAAMDVKTSRLPELCQTDFERGLLEWRLSTEQVVRFLTKLPQTRWCEVCYDELTSSPVATVEKILSFLNLGLAGEIVAFAQNRIRRKTERVGQTFVSERQMMIGGELLPLSTTGRPNLTQFRPSGHRVAK
jgi:hypothetical protein